MDEKKENIKNRIRINFHTREVEVESNEVSIKEVFKIANTIALNFKTSALDEKTIKEKIHDAGIG